MVVVTPLTAIMKDQVSGIVTIDDVCYLYLASPHTVQTASFTSRGLSTAYITSQSGNEDVKRGVHKGIYRLVLSLPQPTQYTGGLLVVSGAWDVLAIRNLTAAQQLHVARLRIALIVYTIFFTLIIIIFINRYVIIRIILHSYGTKLNIGLQPD